MLTPPLLDLQDLQRRHPNVFPETQWWINARLVGINRWLLPHEICLLRLDEFCLLEDLPEAEEQDAHEDHGIICEEGTDVPVAGKEDGVALYDDDNGDEDEAEDVHIRLAPA